jgi:hypothetical protein
MPAGGILFETIPVPVSAKQTGELDAIPAAVRLHRFIAAARPAESAKRKRRWGLLR